MSTENIICFGFNFIAFYLTLSGKVTVMGIYHFSLEGAYFIIAKFNIAIAFV